MNFSCAEDKCYILPPCDSDYSSRINAIVLAKKNYPIDKTNSDTFLDSVYNGMLSGDVKAILKIRGSKARPETAELPGFGNQSIKVGNTNHTIEYMDQYIKENQEFYNAIRQAGSQYDLYYFTKELVWDASGSQITLYGDAVHTDGATDLLEGQATVKWVQKGSPLAIFDDYDSDNFLEGLYYEVSAAAYPNNKITIAENVDIDITMTASLNQYVPNDCDLIWSISDIENPEALATVIINPSTGQIDLNGAGNGGGTLSFTVKVENNCGGCVSGTATYDVTVTST